MADTRADEYLRRFGVAENGRGIWNAHWQEINDRVLARPGGFLTSVVQGSKATQRMFDATAALACQRLAAAIESVICPRSERWHGLEPVDPELADNQDVKAYCEKLTDLLFRVRYGARSAFASETQECFLELCAFGTHSMLVDDMANHEGVYPQRPPIVYMAQPLAYLWIEENELGQVDTLYRKFDYDGRQALQRFGDKTPAKVKDAAEKHSDRRFTFVQCVHPTDDYAGSAWDRRMFPYTSVVVSRDEREVVQEGGYRTIPYAVGRSITTADEHYGRSPAMTLLPDIKMLNEVGKSMIRQVHKQLDPPLLIADDGSATPFDARPNALNYGSVDSQGRQLVHPLQTGGNLAMGQEFRQDLRAVINDGFYLKLFQILVETREMTAYEAALRAQEKGILLAPMMGRQEAEFLGPLIERELDILWSRGVIQRVVGPMPAALEATGGQLKVAYTNQMAHFQRAPEATRTLMAIQQLAPLASLDPTVMDVFDPDGVAQVILDANGVPAKAQRSKADVAAVRGQRQQRQQASDILATAPVAASAAKDLASAQATAQQQPAPPSLTP